MKISTLEEFMPKGVGSITPKNFPNETFELFSIPAFDKGSPEVREGREIGSAKKIVLPQDVLLSKIVPHIRRCWVVSNASTHRQIASGEWIQFRSNNFVPQYLRHFLTSDQFHSQFMKTVTGVGGSLLRARPSEVAKIKIPLPSLDDQKRIAYLLGKVEGAIAQRKQHLQQLDDLLKSIFLEMFGNPVRNEKGWDTNELEDLCEEVIDCPHSTPIYSDEKTGFYCVRSGDIINGYLNLCNTLQVDLTVYEDRIKRYAPRKGDIVYSREGGRLGNAARIVGEEKICLGQRIMLFKTDAQSKSDFLWALLESTAFKAKLQSIIGGGAAPRVNIKDLKKIIVIQPPLDSQIVFSNIVQRVDRIRLSYQQSLTDLEELYGVLSQKAFKGELDLSRVPLTPEGTEATAEEKTETNEPQPTTDTFDLPAPSDLATLHSTEGRNALLDQWLTVWLERLNNAPFTTQPFLESAQQRLWELAEEDALELGAADYDQIKAWISKSLSEGRLAQTYNNANNCVQLKAVSDR